MEIQNESSPLPYRRKLTYHPNKRRLFLSFHAEDKQQVQGFRLMSRNPNVELDFYDGSLVAPINSENSSYISHSRGLAEAGSR